jgi:CSLREA domain-containing protein
MNPKICIPAYFPRCFPRWGSLAGLVLSLGLTANLSPHAWAAAIPVNTTADELNTDGDCALREAIQATNTDSPVDACPAGNGADLITLPAGTYTLVILGTDEDNNATGDMDISGTLTIEGADQTTTILDANQLDRVLHLTTEAATLTLVNLTLQNGKVTGLMGGGLFATGPVVISNTIFLANSASGDSSAGGGALFLKSASVYSTGFFSNTAELKGVVPFSPVRPPCTIPLLPGILPTMAEAHPSLPLMAV